MDGLSFEACAKHVARELARSTAAGLNAANAFQRNLGWDERKLFDRAQNIWADDAALSKALGLHEGGE